MNCREKRQPDGTCPSNAQDPRKIRLIGRYDVCSAFLRLLIGAANKTASRVNCFHRERIMNCVVFEQVALACACTAHVVEG
jgi:hypothetical protein